MITQIKKQIIQILIFMIFFSIVSLSLSHLRAEEKLPVIIETRNIKTSSLNVGERIYKHYCIPCHGINGDGKGFNAKYLDPKPADHTNAKEMGKRTDEKLFDTIYGGGKSVGKSTFMPPWGGTFTEKQIGSLVLYLRKLCECKGPE